MVFSNHTDSGYITLRKLQPQNHINYISAMPSDKYVHKDNFDFKKSHVACSYPINLFGDSF